VNNNVDKYNNHDSINNNINNNLNDNIIGECSICNIAYDDYSSQCRCYKCRMLILVCDECRLNHNKDSYYCEFCVK
jgi:hypothetical protein